MLKTSDPIFETVKWADRVFAQTPTRPLRLDVRVPKCGYVPPLVIYISMAGLRECLKHKTQWWLTDHGYAMATIDCRGSNEAIAPAAVHDCKSAVRWLRAHASEFGYRTDAIGAWGHSAGGLLASLLGNSGDVAALEGDGPCAGVSSAVQAVVDECGSPHDLLYFSDPDVATRYPVVAENLRRYLGGSVNERIELARLVSPRTHIGSHAAPAFILHGADDALAPVDESIAYHVALRQTTDATLRVLPNTGHAWDAAITREDIIRFFDRTLKSGSLARVPVGEGRGRA